MVAMLACPMDWPWLQHVDSQERRGARNAFCFNYLYVLNESPLNFIRTDHQSFFFVFVRPFVAGNCLVFPARENLESCAAFSCVAYGCVIKDLRLSFSGRGTSFCPIR
jgi:hypothetical protein